MTVRPADCWSREENGRCHSGEKLLLLGTLLTAGPLVAVAAITLLSHRTVSSAAHSGTVQLASEDMKQMLMLVEAMSRVYVDEREHQIRRLLAQARELLDARGAVHVLPTGGADALATNQFTSERRTIYMPTMLVGGTPIELTRDAARTSPIVDDVRSKPGVVATIFQRMNEAGDMLRIATNVTGKDGGRAVGTFLPAVNPDRAPNPVVSAVMRGETFVGRAFVVDRWYRTAYEPLQESECDE